MRFDLFGKSTYQDTFFSPYSELLTGIFNATGVDAFALLISGSPLSGGGKAKTQVGRTGHQGTWGLY